MLGNCRLTSLNYLIQRKTIVVVGRCISQPNHDLLAESNFWWYLQLISATLRAYRSTGTWCAPKTCSSRFCRSLILSKWMILSTLLMSPGLTPWLNSFSSSLRPLNVTPRHRTFNLWGSPSLNCAWTLIHPHCFKSTQ